MSSTARGRLIAKLAKLASVTHQAEVEDSDPADHFGYASLQENMQAVANVREMSRRSLWGWCCVKTTAEWSGFRGVTYLGACSYESADAFTDAEGKAQTFEACAALLDNLTEAKVSGQLAADLLSHLRRR